MAEVTLSGISKSYGAEVALMTSRMTIPDGSFVVLLGANRCRQNDDAAHGVGLGSSLTRGTCIGGRDVLV